MDWSHWVDEEEEQPTDEEIAENLSPIYEIAFDWIMDEINGERAMKNEIPLPTPKSNPIFQEVSHSPEAGSPSDPPTRTYPAILLDM